MRKRQYREKFKISTANHLVTIRCLGATMVPSMLNVSTRLGGIIYPGRLVLHDCKYPDSSSRINNI